MIIVITSTIFKINNVKVWYKYIKIIIDAYQDALL